MVLLRILSHVYILRMKESYNQMMIGEEPWEAYHHHCNLLDDIEDYSNELNHPLVVDFLLNSIFIDIVESK